MNADGAHCDVYTKLRSSSKTFDDCKETEGDENKEKESRKMKDRTQGGGGTELIPYKGLMGTCSQQGMFFGIFVLNRVSILSILISFL